MQICSILSLLLSASAAFAAPTPVVNEATPVQERNVEARNDKQCAQSGIKNPGKVVSAFTSSGVVPTLIPSINPKVAVTVTYGSKSVNLGNSFTTAETTNQPALSFTSEPGYDAPTTKYAFFLVDPDVPNPDAGALRMTYLHWAVHDAQANCVTKQKRVTDTAYEALTPASTQQHRYTFLVYRQPAGYTVSVTDLATLQKRPGFDVNAYAAKKGLTLVGGNFLREAITNT